MTATATATNITLQNPVHDDTVVSPIYKLSEHPSEISRYEYDGTVEYAVGLKTIGLQDIYACDAEGNILIDSIGCWLALAQDGLNRHNSVETWMNLLGYEIR